MVMGVSRFLDGFRMENPVKIRMITRGTPLGGNPNLVGGLDAIFYFPINIGFLIIPIDELIFSRGVAQPPAIKKISSAGYVELI